ncbi:MAG TPA: type II secretion system F family protein [Thermoplasmata archaeon]|nr:type II secretion system F family protein [Thermoplasmata archaeon]
MRKLLVPLLLLSVALLGVLPASVATDHPATSPITITPVAPLPGATINSETPNITATFTDTAGRIDPSTLVIYIDTENVTGIQGVQVTPTKVSYQVPNILKLSNGNHTATITIGDTSGHTAQYSWGFVVNTSAVSPSPPLGGVSASRLVLYVILGAAIAGAGYGAWILYLKQTRNFTFRKYFATHPVNKQYLVLYVPVVAAFVFVLIGLDYVYSTPGLPLLAPEYVIIIAIFIALTAFSLDARREKARIRAYERAFAQFLFEMADAMRGGIDPGKAIVELSKTHTNILRTPLRVAADGIRIGRPFDATLRNMALPMKSPLIKRYADLIADASTVGGETSLVVHRAAKDMDDFIKIEQERATSLAMPVAVLYVSFGVLLAVLFSLLSIAPSLGSINISLIGSGSGSSVLNGGSSGVASVPKLSYGTLEQRFFDLMLITSIGTGVIIGAFTEGKAKYGLLHSLFLLAVSAIAFTLFVH